MRILHTGDWHVGRSIRGRSRRAEFEKALSQVVDIARDQVVDLLLVAGDIYDSRTAASAEADELIYNTFLELNAAGVPVVAIPGNHDSTARLAAVAPLLAHIGCTIVPKVRAPDAGGAVTVSSRDGRESARICCVPFVSPRRFSDAAAEFEDLASGYVGYDAGIGAILAAHEASFAARSLNIVMAHAFLAGAEQAGSERQVTVGGDYAVAPSRLPATATYVALGHIHKQQKIPGAPCEARYAGSLIQLDFGERGQDKSVLIIDAEVGKPPKVTPVEVVAGRQLIDLEGSLEDLEALTVKAEGAFVRLNLKVDAPTPGLVDRIRELIPDALEIRLVTPEQEQDEEQRHTLRGLEPREQFVAYYRAERGAEPPPELLEAFDRVHEDVTST